MKSKITLIILIVIIVILGGTTIFFEYKYSQKSDEIVTISAELETTQAELAEYRDTTTTAAGEVIEVETVVEKYAITKFDENKLVVKDETITSYGANNFYACSCRGTLYVENNVATFSMSNSSTGYSESHTYTIGERIVDALKWTVGQGTDEFTCLVTESGDVYANLASEGTDECRKIEGVSNICKVYSVVATRFDGNYWAIVAIDTDGNAYDIQYMYRQMIQ